MSMVPSRIFPPLHGPMLHHCPPAKMASEPEAAAADHCRADDNRACLHFIVVTSRMSTRCEYAWQAET
eukprot:scaffold672835_cov57-Prasinocladus_malaysianus.AAC.1